MLTFSVPVAENVSEMPCNHLRCTCELQYINVDLTRAHMMLTLWLTKRQQQTYFVSGLTISLVVQFQAVSLGVVVNTIMLIAYPPPP